MSKNDNLVCAALIFPPLLVVDPPWPYQARATDTTHRARNPYLTMTMAQIKALRIAEMASPDGCTLWLWTTCAFFWEAFECLDAWGFDYVTTMTWAKDRIGLGDWLRGQTEHCLVATKGGPTRTLAERQRDADEKSLLLFAPMRAHSRKPDEFYPMVDALCANKWEANMHPQEPLFEMNAPSRSVVIDVADGKTVTAYALEIFARVVNGCIRPGWAVVGNEFLFSDDPPWRVRWRGLKGSAEKKLAAFDPELAARLTRREITLHAAKAILWQRDCDALAEHCIAQLEKATAPHLALVPRLNGRTHSVRLVLRCVCGTRWERLTYFGCENWYWVRCPSCKALHSFRMMPSRGFEFRPTPAIPGNIAEFLAGLNACIPIRELEAAA